MTDATTPTPTPTVTAEVFYKDNCPYCVHAKRLLEQKGIEYTQINVAVGTTDEVNTKRNALIERVESTGAGTPKTLPQIFLDGQYIGGFDNLEAHLKNQ